MAITTQLGRHNMSYFVHDSAIVDDGAIVGAESKIWHYTHVCSTAEIGSGCVLGQNVFVADGVKLGNNVRVQNNVSIYSGVLIEDDAFCGPSCVFTNVINPRSQVSRKDEFKNTYVRKGATIGANATIVCGNEIGKYAFIAAGAVVTKSVPPFSVFAGVPAKHIGWISMAGCRLELPLVGHGEARCKESGLTYRLEDTHLSLVE